MAFIGRKNGGEHLQTGSVRPWSPRENQNLPGPHPMLPLPGDPLQRKRIGPESLDMLPLMPDPFHESLLVAGQIP